MVRRAVQRPELPTRTKNQPRLAKGAAGEAQRNVMAFTNLNGKWQNALHK